MTSFYFCWRFPNSSVRSLGVEGGYIFFFSTDLAALNQGLENPRSWRKQTMLGWSFRKLRASVNLRGRGHLGLPGRAGLRWVFPVVLPGPRQQQKKDPIW
jgi:hypothetical protein